MKIKKLSGVWASGIALMLGLLMFLQIPVAAASQDLNYGKGTASDRKLTASQMYAGMYGNDLSEAERNALDALAEVSLTYSRVPDSVVKCEYDNDNAVLTILVNTYEYTAQNGERVVWRPTKVWFNKGAADQRSATLKKKAEGLYQCSFSGMTKSQEFMLDVDFVWEVKIEAEIADKLVTLPYTVGEAAYEELKEYEDYQEALAAYEWYLAYPAKKAAYDKYLEQKAVYDKEKEAYDAYVDALAKYQLDLAKYNENQQKKKAYEAKSKAYYEYQEYRMQYAVFYDEYEVYLKNYTQVKNALKVLDTAYKGSDIVGTDIGWTFYRAIKGKTATSFLDALEGKEAATGIPRALLDEAKDAGEELTKLLVEYDKIRSASYESNFEKIRAKFAYYDAHYEELCQSLKVFHTDMKEIYCTKGIPALVDGVGKTAQVQMMVAQTYALYTALDDSVTMDPNWVLKYSSKGQKALNELLPDVLFPTDTNLASPKKVTMPETEMKLPEGQMEPVEHPGDPDYDSTLTKPLVPAPVTKPTAPKAVENPGAQPDACEEPTYVAEPSLTSVERALAEERRKGTLTERVPSGQNTRLKLTQTVSCKRSFQAVNVVTFYYSDGTKVGEILVDKMFSLKQYADEIPEREREGDAINAFYRFRGWLVSGEDFETRYPELVSKHLSTEQLCALDIKGDWDVVADYDVTPRSYTITWIVGGKTESQNYHYGQIPVCPVSTELPKQGEISFVFRGWLSDLVPVQGDATYQALYEEVRPKYRVTWIYGLNGEHEIVTWVTYGYPADASSIPVQVAPSEYYYRFDGWNETPSSSVKGELTYRAKYSAIPIAKHGDGSVCAVEHTSNAVSLKPTQSLLQISDALEYAAEMEKQLEIVWDGFSVTFTAEQIQVLRAGKCAKLSLVEERRATDGAIYYQLDFMTKLYSYDPQLSLDVAVRRPSFDRVIGVVYLAAEASETEMDSVGYASKLVFSMQSGDRVLYRPKYILQVTDPSGKSDYSEKDGTTVVGGETVDLSSVKCDYGYEIVGATLIYSDGTREQVGVQFVMPADPVSVELIAQRIVFHITFEVEGQVYREMDLFFEDLIVLPEDPTKAEDDSYTYSFDGWSPQVWNKAVDRNQRNPVFTAVFTAYPKVALAADDYQGTLVIRVVVIGLLGIVLLVGSILCIIHRKRLADVVRRGVKGIVILVRGGSSNSSPSAKGEVEESTNEPSSSEDEDDESKPV